MRAACLPCVYICIPGLIQFMFRASRSFRSFAISETFGCKVAQRGTATKGGTGTETVDGNEAEGVDSKEMQKRDREEARRKREWS